MAYTGSNGGNSWSPLPMDTREAPVLTPTRRAPPIPGSASRAAAPSPSSSPGVYARTPTHTSGTRSPQTAHSGGAMGSPGPATIVRRGWVTVKEDGLRAWLWSKRWLVLREHTLSFYKSEVRQPAYVPSQHLTCSLTCRCWPPDDSDSVRLSRARRYHCGDPGRLEAVLPRDRDSGKDLLPRTPIRRRAVRMARRRLRAITFDGSLESDQLCASGPRRLRPGLRRVHWPARAMDSIAHEQRDHKGGLCQKSTSGPRRARVLHRYPEARARRLRTRYNRNGDDRRRRCSTSPSQTASARRR